MTTAVEQIWTGIESVTGQRALTVSVAEYAQIIGISRISAHRLVARGDVQKLDLPLSAIRIPVSEIFRAFGVTKEGTAEAPAAPDDISVSDQSFELDPKVTP